MLFSKSKSENVNQHGAVSGAHRVMPQLRSVKILGSGCASCNQLEKAARDALEELQIEVTIEHVRDFGDIASYGVMSTPALVVNDVVLSSGKVLKKKDIVKLLEQLPNEQTL